MTMIHNPASVIDALAHIELHPESHEQAVWAQRTACGTRHCLAGWICAAAGLEFRWESCNVGALAIAVLWSHPKQPPTPRSVAGAALDLLGASTSEDRDEIYSSLFGSDLTLDDIYAAVSRLAGIGEPELREQVADRAAELRAAEAAEVPA